MSLHPTYIIILAGLVSLVVCLIMTPVIIRFATKRGVVDKPDERKCHPYPIPQLGGTAVVSGIIAAVFVCFPFLPKEIRPDEIYAVMGISLGACLSFIIGLFDDLFGLKPGRKFIFQVCVAAGTILFGVKIAFLTGILTDYIYLSRTLAVLITIIWVTGLMNAINLIDGLDGLASGITAIAALAFMILGIAQGQVAAALLAAALLGASLGFIPFNWHPAKIFLGDAGALIMGYMLATISILGPFKTATALAVAIPVLILALPIFDTSWAMLRRSLAGRKISEADNNHIHHQLAKKGLGHVGTVLVLYGIAIVLAAIAVIAGIYKITPEK